jgi:transposase
MIDEVAQDAGVSRVTVYRKLKTYEKSGKTSSLVGVKVKAASRPRLKQLFSQLLSNSASLKACVNIPLKKFTRR